MDGSDNRVGPASARDFAPSEETRPARRREDVVRAAAGKPAVRCRTNSRRGLTDPTRRSYPPVESVRRALEILRMVNRLRIASVSDLHAATGLPKPTIVRMLETLIADDYVARDNMCGGYRVTCRARELNAGYEGISRVIEASRAWALDLTQRLKWPIGIGVLDGDAIALQFWTGAISPYAHTNTVLGLRPNLLSTAMGRAYLGFCSDDERERLLDRIRRNPDESFGANEEKQFRQLLERVRRDGYAMRDPQVGPTRTTTLGAPLRDDGAVIALVSISFYTTAVAKEDIHERIVKPFLATRGKIEETIALMRAADSHRDAPPGRADHDHDHGHPVAMA